MPKVKNKNLPILLYKKNFFSASLNKQELENRLISLMKAANEHYKTVYLKSKKKLDIAAFNSCKEEFQKIKSIIESEGNPTQLTNALYFEAWISILYSDVHALNLDLETEKKLNALHKKILAVEADFNQLQTKKSSLDTNDNNSQLSYIDSFQKFWFINKNRLQADCYYNLAEFFIKKLNFKKSIRYLKKAVIFYKETAEKSINSIQKAKFINLAAKTNERIEFVMEQFNKNQYNALTPPLKKLILHFQKLPNSLSRWKIINKKSLFSSKALSQTIHKVKNSSSSYPRKRKKKLVKKLMSNDINTQTTKKIKKNPSIYNSGSLWNTSRKKILDEFINIEINLVHLSNPKKSYDERKAIAYNNYALFLVENLNNPKKNCLETEKLASLKKAEQQLEKSIEFYNIDGVTHCISLIRSIRKYFENHIKGTPGLNEQYHEYQHRYSTRYARQFFKGSSSTDNKQGSTQQTIKKMF